MPSALASIVISSASAVGKTFLIGAAGYYAVKRPKSDPYLPTSSINMLSRLSFNILILPLIYTGVASSVTLESLVSLWPVLFFSFVIIFASYLVSTILAYLPFFRIDKEDHFCALRIAICFPNIVAIPILIFPTLCEYLVFREFGNIPLPNESDTEIDTVTPISQEESIATCETESNSIVFTYFFGFSVLFWGWGYYSLTNSKDRTTEQDENSNNDELNRSHSIIRRRRGKCETIKSKFKRLTMSAFKVIKTVVLSPGFIVLIIAFVTACIEPLQKAMFQPGGMLRVIGSTLEALTSAGATFATIVVAAALANNDDKDEGENILDNTSRASECKREDNISSCSFGDEDEKCETDVLPLRKSDPSTNENNDISVELSNKNIDHDKASSILPTKTRLLQTLSKIQNHPTFKVQVWHVMSRLFVTPAVVFGMLMKMSCFFYISPIGRVILLVNSAVPGSLIVVVILNAQGLTKAASMISQTYLPSYTLSVITITIWATIGMISFSDSNVCS